MSDTVDGTCKQADDTDAAAQPKPPRLPRSQKKKLARERYRQKRKLKRRENRMNARERASTERREMLAAMTEEERAAFIQRERQLEAELKQREEAFLEDAYENGLPICINCTFDDDMNETELKSLAKQIAVVYNEIKCMRAKIKLSITGLDTQSQWYSRLQLFNVDKWKIRKYSQNYWEVYDTQNIVVLSPDAEEYLEEMEPDKVYVIGGLVDRNIKKKTTLAQAQDHGLVTRALPIPKYFPQCKKKVLNINAVIEILVMRANNSTWQHAFQKCIPTRARTENP
ncbi:putative protein,putative protein [Babesia divergens]|uniref:tRNA (guanine(9)-N(1))-methyltransferase n=1 Tax=Babesia divergens TaxID=32595 RepID=A0AAD9G905_BABDI|nr:putative protein,putative protein [Babesia divergens]